MDMPPQHKVVCRRVKKHRILQILENEQEKALAREVALPGEKVPSVDTHSMTTILCREI